MAERQCAATQLWAQSAHQFNLRTYVWISMFLCPSSAFDANFLSSIQFFLSVGLNRELRELMHACVHVGRWFRAQAFAHRRVSFVIEHVLFIPLC